MNDNECRRELQRDMDIEALAEKMDLATHYFRLGVSAGFADALKDALKAKDRLEIIEALTARLAPTVGKEQ
jgi:putative ubiquitin-RnfH superfamily antitoxin RatB of RatAB toxin-antitoxin module